MPGPAFLLLVLRLKVTVELHRSDQRNDEERAKAEDDVVDEIPRVLGSVDDEPGGVPAPGVFVGQLGQVGASWVVGDVGERVRTEVPVRVHD